MNVDSLYPSKYLRADDVNGRELSGTIAGLEVEPIAGDGKEKPVLYLTDHEQGLVLNKTNAQMIAHSYGKEVTNWIGKPIVLHRDMVQFQGKFVPCIRVRVPAADAGDEMPIKGV